MAVEQDVNESAIFIDKNVCYNWLKQHGLSCSTEYIIFETIFVANYRWRRTTDPVLFLYFIDPLAATVCYRYSQV